LTKSVNGQKVKSGTDRLTNLKLGKKNIPVRIAQHVTRYSRSSRPGIEIWQFSIYTV